MTTTPWWGPRPDGPWSCSLGPFRLWATSEDGEHLLAWSRGDDPLQEGRAATLDDAAPDDADTARFVCDAGSLQLHPALADRAVVVRPEAPLFLGPGGEVTFLVSTPVWVQARLEGAGKALWEAPSFRPSDTWFGPTPREGELCYASRTRARLERAASPATHARAATALTLINQGADATRIDRVSLPMPRLALYEDGDGLLWTETLTVTRSTGGELAEVTLGRGDPPRCVGGTRIAEPRSADRDNVFTRAVSSLLG